MRVINRTDRRWRRNVTTARRSGVQAAAMVCGLLIGGAGLAQNVTPEYQLKAAFIAKFPEFTEWPARALDSKSTFDLCVARPNPLGSALSDFVAGEALSGRPLQVREIAATDELASCLLLFVPARSAPDQKMLLTAAQKLPLLTVGETPTFLDGGGIVQLRLVDGRVRFDINATAAERVGIRFSSQLLRLALNVRGGPS